MNQPNILLIMADQHNADAGGWAGNPDVKTPHLDALADDGVACTRAYCNNPVCSPSRMSFITGQYVHTHGYHGNENNGLSVSNPHTLANVLRQHGYQTGLVGKSHTVMKWDQESYEFIRYNGFCDADPQDPLTNHYFKYLVDQGLADKCVEGMENKSGIPESYNGSAPLALDDEHTNERFTGNQSIDFLKNRDASRPFFLTTSFLRPHDPYMPSSSYFDIYDPATLTLPDNISDAQSGFAGKPDHLQSIARRVFTRGDAAANRFEFAKGDASLLRRALASYYGLVSANDYEIGRIIAYLKETGEYDNTIILYTSDHGDFAGEHGLMAKCFSMYDAIHRIPLIIKYPGCSAGTTSEAMIESIDVYPTICHLAGVPVPAMVEGKTFVSDSGVESSKVSAFCESSSQRAIRTKDYRLVYAQNGQHELYDYRSDPGEMVNCYDDSDYREVRYTLIEKLLRFTSRYAKLSGGKQNRGVFERDPSTPTMLIHKAGYYYSELAPDRANLPIR